MFKILLSIVVTFLSLTSSFANSNNNYNQVLQSNHTQRNIKCLADNIYYEAGNQTITGKIAVAYTTLNRVLSNRFPDSVCDVVYQRTKKVCQFSWVCERRKYKKIVGHEKEVYRQSKLVAVAVLYSYNKKHDPSLGALFYHAEYVNPRWKKKRLVQIDDHIFYR